MPKSKRDKFAVAGSYAIMTVMLVIATISGYMFRGVMVKLYGVDYSILNSTVAISAKYQQLFAFIGVGLNVTYLIIKVYKGLFRDRRSDRR